MIRNLILLWLKIYFASASQKQLNNGSCNLQSKRYDKWLNKLQDDQSLIESKFSVEKMICLVIFYFSMFAFSDQE